MDLVVYSQYYRTRTPERQLEIDECLHRNLNHPGISRMVLFCESDAPPLPEGTVPVEVVASDERITYAKSFRWVKRQGSDIGQQLNAENYLDEGLEHLTATCNGPDTFLTRTRTNPGHAGFHLNNYPHWTQDAWGVRADAELPEGLLYASSFPLGFPGCDNRTYSMIGSHGLRPYKSCAAASLALGIEPEATHAGQQYHCNTFQSKCGYTNPPLPHTREPTLRQALDHCINHKAHRF